MRSLKPPAVTTPEGVTYRPLPVRRLGWLWLAMVGVSTCTAALTIGQLLTSLLFVAAAVTWWLAFVADARLGEVTVGLHRLVVTERLLGLSRRSLDLPWEEVEGARVEGDRLVVLHAGGRVQRTAVRGTPGQIAWIAGHVAERVRAVTLPEEEARLLEEDRLKVLDLLRQGATVTETP